MCVPIIEKSGSSALLMNGRVCEWKMMFAAMYCFLIRNCGKFFFRIGGRESYFSNNTEQKAASISS